MTAPTAPEWSFEHLWQKSKLYMQRAFEEDRNGPLFPFWAALALELLGRTALASVHGVLLADPQDGKNIMHAMGFPPHAHTPRSVPAKTVFLRCMAVVPNFTQREFDLAMALVDRRNAELHTGALGFENYPSRLWLTDMFRISALLVDHFGKSLEDYLGPHEAEAASRMITGARDVLGRAIEQRVVKHRDAMEGIDPEDLVELKAKADRLVPGPLEVRVQCPSCGSTALLGGEQIGVDEPRLDNDTLIVKRTLLPTQLKCSVCDLVLSSYQELDAAAMGGHVQIQEDWDPAEYYAPEIEDLQAAWAGEDDYMNE